MSDVTHYCVGWRKDFIQILDALAKQYLLEAETLLSELKVGVIKNKNKLKKECFLILRKSRKLVTGFCFVGGLTLVKFWLSWNYVLYSIVILEA